MKGRCVFTAVVFLLFTACSKRDIQVHSLERTLSVKEAETKPQVYSTAWESIPAWSAQTAPDAMNFSYTRSVPQLSNEVLDNGVVLVFARNLWEEKGELKELAIPDKPLMMPFYFLPYFEKPG